MSIKKNISTGVFYTAISKYSGIIISIVIGAILSRLLSPTEFGTVAVVMVFITFFNLLSDFGLGPAIVQNKELDTNDIRSLFSFSILLGFIFALLFFLSAPLIAHFYENTNLKNIARLLSLSVLFYSWSIVPNALNLKKLRFKRIGFVSISIQTISGIGAIILAYHGFSYYSLIYKSIFDGLASFLIYYFMEPVLPILKFKIASVKKVISFSVYQFLFNFINYFSRNADNLLIGKFFGAAPLGYYNKSYQLMSLPVQNITHVITPVLLPVLSEFQNDKTRIFNAYCRVVQLLAIIGFPLSIVLFFVAPELIQILYGSQWEQSIPVFKILSLTVGLQMVLSSSGSIYQSVNRTDLLFLAGLLNAIFMVAGIFFGIFYEKSLVFVAYGLLVAFIVGFIQTFTVLVIRVLGHSFLEFIKLFIKPVLTSITMAIVLYISTLLAIENLFYSLGLKLSLALFVFIPFFLSSSYNLAMMKQIINKFKK